MIHCNYTIKYKFFIDFICTHTYPCLPLHRPTCYLIGSPQCNQCVLMLKSDRIHFAESLDMRELDTIPFGGQRLCEVFWWHTFSAAFPDGILSSLTSQRIHARPTQDVCQMRARVACSVGYWWGTPEWATLKATLQAIWRTTTAHLVTNASLVGLSAKVCTMPHIHLYAN